MGVVFELNTKTWSLSINRLQEFKRMFKDEVYYITPLWEIEGTEPPQYSNLYKFNSDFNLSLI